MEIDIKKIKGLSKGFKALDKGNEEVVFLTEDGSIKYALLTSADYDELVSKEMGASIKILNPLGGDITYDEYEEIKKQVLEALDKTFKPKPEKLN